MEGIMESMVSAQEIEMPKEQAKVTPISIALVNVRNTDKPYAMNKDLNGGFGTADDYDLSWSSRIIRYIKQKSIKLPIVSLAFLQALLKEKGHVVQYFEGSFPEKEFDLILIYGSIVDCKNENETAEKLKKKFPKSKVGITGPFPSTKPDVFDKADFVLIGEAEAFFMNQFQNLDQLHGHVLITSQTDMDALPSPDFEGFPIHEYGYSPAINKKPFIVLQASKGCPYSCSFYCTYGKFQGPRIRQRSPKKVVDDMLHVQKKYGIKGIQFRDPTFGLMKPFIPAFCEELKNRGVKIQWGMETRLDILNEEKIKMMYDVGLRNLNVGIETVDPDIAKKNQRLLINDDHQKKMIRFCEKLGVKVSAFYILCYEGDNEESIRKSIDYAISLNTPLARFSISTPYPGTGFYAKLEKEGKIIDQDLEHYTQFNLVFKHDHLTQEQAKKMLGEAFRRYYFRPSYFARLLQWKLRGY